MSASTIAHKSGCHTRTMRNLTLSADGRTRYGICEGCGVRVQERVRLPRTRREAPTP